MCERLVQSFVSREDTVDTVPISLMGIDGSVPYSLWSVVVEC